MNIPESLGQVSISAINQCRLIWLGFMVKHKEPGISLVRAVEFLMENYQSNLTFLRRDEAKLVTLKVEYRTKLFDRLVINRYYTFDRYAVTSAHLGSYGNGPYAPVDMITQELYLKATEEFIELIFKQAGGTLPAQNPEYV